MFFFTTIGFNIVNHWKNQKERVINKLYKIISNTELKYMEWA